jgi:hypothetical protein
VTSPQRRKGSRFELDVVAYLREHGFPYAERAYGAGRPEDVGDIDGVAGFVVECKAHKSIDLAGFIDEADRERSHARQPFAVVIAKRRNKSTGESYVVMPLSQFCCLIADDDDTNDGDE